MRSLTTIALALVASALVLGAAGSRARADDPPAPWLVDELDLYAGQYTPIGTVTVTTDGTSLYVRYETNGEWVLTDTHLYIDVTAPTKLSPGQFPYGEEGLSNVTTWNWESTLSNLGVELGDTLYIAAHAVAREIAEEITILSDTSTQVIRFNGVNLDPYEPAELAWVHPSWDAWITNPFFSDSAASWIWATEYVAYPQDGEVVWFRREFTLPDSYVPLGATLRIAADNGYLAFLNGEYAAHHGIALTTEHGGWELCHDECHVPMWCWQCAVETWDVGDLLVAGANTFTVGAVNEQMGGGTVESNPAAVIFELRITYASDREETAWADGDTDWTHGWGSYGSFLLSAAP